MGASEFACRAAGEDVAAAFRNAVEQAQYDHGHAGYTGTIAEKDGYELITNEVMTPEAGVAFAHKLMYEDDDPRVTDKWGPAGAIQLTGGSFLFFGWASS